MKIGIVYFDDVKKMESGWGAVNGGKPFRFSLFTDLPSDIVWVTNGDFDFSFKSGKRNHQNLKLDGFLGIKLKDIENDLSVHPDVVTTPVTVQSISKIAFNLATTAEKIYGDFSDKYRLNEKIIENLQLKDDGKKVPFLFQPIFTNAFQQYSSCQTSFLNNSKVVKVRRNRMDHARDIFSMPMPAGGWERVTRKQLPKDPAKALEMVLELENPVLAKVRVSNMDQFYGNLMAFGVNYSKKRNAPREWVSHPELFILANKAKVEIEELYIGERYESFPKELMFPKEYMDEMQRYSYSLGVLAENHWKTLCEGIDAGNKQRIYSARDVWIKSMDRYLSYRLAKNFYDEEFIVVSYGDGGCAVRIDLNDMNRFETFLDETGFPYPVTDATI